MKEPKGPLVEIFDDAAVWTRKPTRRMLRRRAANKPILEITSPGLVGLFDLLATRNARNARKVARIRRDLTWAHAEALAMGILP